jgi:hypothetical protein
MFVQDLFFLGSGKALLVPRDTSSSSVLPLNGEQRRIFEALGQGWQWDSVISELSPETAERLVVLGILRGYTDTFSLSGPALALMLRGDADSKPLTSITTDPLSAECLAYVARMPLSDVNSVATRLYLFNHSGVYQSDILSRATQDIGRVLARPMGQFMEVPPPSFNPGWHFFSRTGQRRKSRREQEAGCKVYISPRVHDTAECLSRLVELLPHLQCSSWKIGRGEYGIARADKICLYFLDERDGIQAATILTREMHGLTTQGIPFTHRFDCSGLISLGWDPPSPAGEVDESNVTSWRNWVAKKMATGLLLARGSQSYPLSPEQSALWTIKLLGIDPTSWRVENPNFWRN